MSEPNYECAQCGHRMWASFSGNVDFAVVVGCPGCGYEMDRLDSLGQIEKDARHGIGPLNLRAAIQDRLP